MQVGFSERSPREIVATEKGREEKSDSIMMITDHTTIK